MSNHALTLQLLEWIAAAPRSYRETMEAWRSNCPRLSIWEDACIDGLIDASGSRAMALTDKGRAFLLGAANDRATARMPG